MFQSYSVCQTSIDGVEVVQLADAARRISVAVAVSMGNTAYELRVNGKNAFWFPFGSLGEWAKKPVLCGNPFLAPWANRLSQDGYYANGRKHALNPDLGNVRRDGGNLPIHGLLLFSPLWKTVSAEADGNSAVCVARLEFWKLPELMAQFPFAHTLTMTHRLSNGALEVEILIDNHASEPMPVSIGYHPYLRLPGSPRDQWKVRLAARRRLLLDGRLIPTGEQEPFAAGEPFPLSGIQLDDVYGDLARDSEGRAHFVAECGSETVRVIYGPKYRVAVVYAPSNGEFVCFEPMAAITDAFNLAHAGVYRELQSVPEGGQWRESFWIAPSGF